MIKRKRFRQKGKARLSRTFAEFNKNDRVVILGQPGSAPVPPHFRALTGTVTGNIGKAVIVRFLNGKVVKNLVIKPEHLKKVKS